jgi:protein involved in polysaccharide export with SLBB domain
MFQYRLPRFRFSLKSVLVLFLGISIGYSLNLQTVRLLVGPPNEARMSFLPTYEIEPPDILQVDAIASFSDTSPSISGQHLVGPDGNINLGNYGPVFVAGKTLSEVQDAIEKALEKYVKSPQVVVDVRAYNSKVYYVVTQGAAAGDNVARMPITGNETVLDAFAAIGRLPAPETTKIWISRPAINGVGKAKMLPVDLDDITRGVSTASNYQLMPGDRLFVSHRTSPSLSN